MGTAVVVEILDRRGRLRERRRLTQLPATIGRSAACDVILDDPFVSPEHLRLELQEGDALMVVDLDSTNGLIAEGNARRVKSIALNGSLALQLGETRLRLRTPQEVIAPAVPLPRRPARSELSVAVRLAVMWTLLISVAAGSEYLRAYDELRAETLASQITGNTVLLLVWSGLWAASNRIVSHHSNFLEHSLNAAFWGFFLALARELDGYVAFALAADKAVNITFWIVDALLLAGLLHGHLRLCASGESRRLKLRALAVSTGVTLLSAFVSLAGYLQGPRWDFILRFRNELKPPMFRLAGSESVESFFARSRELKTRVDQLVNQK